MKKLIAGIGAVIFAAGLFIAAGVADAKVNDDYNAINCPQTEVIIQTVYIIDGDAYIVDERVEDHSITWCGDFPVLN